METFQNECDLGIAFFRIQETLLDVGETDEACFEFFQHESNSDMMTFITAVSTQVRHSVLNIWGVRKVLEVLNVLEVLRVRKVLKVLELLKGLGGPEGLGCLEGLERPEALECLEGPEALEGAWRSWRSRMCQRSWRS